MKLSKTALLVLGIGIFVIAFAAMFSISSGQRGEQERLDGSLATAQALLPKLIAEREDLEGQLAEWEEKVAGITSALNTSEARFPKAVESVEFDEALFLMAEDSNLQVVELSATEPRNKTEKDTDITYALTIFEVKVRSAESPPITAEKFETYIDETLDNMLDFINTIATSQEFNIGTIEVVAIEDLEPPVEEVEENAVGPEATIQITVYAFPR
jgi:hypothetical protein